MISAIVGRIWKDIKKYIGVAVIVVIYYVVVHTLMPVACPLIYMTGFPCAGCGMTRAVWFVLTGQFARAFYMNPVAFVIVLFGGYCFFCRYIKGIPVKGFLAGIIIICVLLFLAYFIRMYLYFPDREPYVYWKDNVLEHQLPGYGSIIKEIFFD